MKIVYMLRKQRDFLTDQHVLVAYRFYKRPYDFKMSPSLFRVLRELIIDETPIEVFEKRRGWPARSAKQCLRLLLDSLIECEGDSFKTVAEIDEDHDAREQLDFVTAADASSLLLAMRKHGFTMMEAKVYLCLKRAPNGALSKEGIMRRIYSDRSTDEVPDVKIVDVHMCKVRKKLKGERIVTIQAVGYQLIAEGDEEGGYEAITE